MRKKTLNCLFDNIMWYAIYLLPFLGYLVALFHDPTLSLSTFLSSFDLLTSNFAYVVFDDLFGTNGIVPLFATGSPILIYSAYFICTLLIHCCIDVLAFIPRIAHKWINISTQQDD